ncbi:MAG TPA: response regulator [Acidobacteriaceae bacterium]|jgi:DNA-binding response OmpR family regulator
MQLLIVEDHPKDLQIATSAAQASGFSVIDACSSASMAKQFLEKALRGEQSLPNVIVLDLDLGYESGFELLRFWHSTPQLAEVPLVIWTILGDQYRDICRMFKVRAYVYKGEGVSGLRQVLSGLSGVAA